MGNREQMGKKSDNQYPMGHESHKTTRIMDPNDVADLLSVLNEQIGYINTLEHFGSQHGFDKHFLFHIKQCNKVIKEIVNGPTGGIEKLVERTK